MGYEKPLLFVDSPVISEHVYVPAAEPEIEEEEESTSVFDPRHHLPDPPVVIAQGQGNAIELDEVKPDIQKIIDFFSASFRRELYQPLEFVTAEQETVKGRLLEINENKLRVELVETGIITDLSAEDLIEIKWRQQPFIP